MFKNVLHNYFDVQTKLFSISRFLDTSAKPFVKGNRAVRTSETFIIFQTNFEIKFHYRKSYAWQSLSNRSKNLTSHANIWKSKKMKTKYYHKKVIFLSFWNPLGRLRVNLFIKFIFILKFIFRMFFQFIKIIYEFLFRRLY